MSNTNAVVTTAVETAPRICAIVEESPEQQRPEDKKVKEATSVIEVFGPEHYNLHNYSKEVI